MVMRKLFLKVLNVITVLTHPEIPKKYCYYITHNYYSRFIQIKYYFRNHYFKKRYKTVEYRGEFQQELTFVLPFAYWHFLNGTLNKTISTDNTKELYFFSSNHQEIHKKRDWLYNAETFEIPNMTHSNSFSYKKWVRVPLKQFYKNKIFVFDKPILVIANKYNIEWECDPINFLSISVLHKIISCYSPKYQIIYNRPLASQIVSDNSEILDLGEHDWLKENHPKVILMNDLFTEYQNEVNNFNHLQLMVYANCNHFVSVHGGTAALASYFGGTNVIFSKRGMEHVFNEFNTIFPKLSGAKILHAKKEQELFNYLQDHL
jgi:hypothetical protein